MPKVRTLRPHTVGGKIMFRGEIYSENENITREKVRIGLVEVADVRAKVDAEMYAPRSYDVPAVEPEIVSDVDSEVSLISKSGNWYLFSDGDKVLGRKAAAEKLGVEELPDVDSDDD